MWSTTASTGDWPALRAAGVADVFGPGTVIPDAALRLLDLLEKSLAAK